MRKKSKKRLHGFEDGSKRFERIGKFAQRLLIGKAKKMRFEGTPGKYIRGDPRFAPNPMALYQ